MSHEPNDDIDLAALAPVAPSREAKERTHASARAAFVRATEERDGALGPAIGWFRRALVPAVLVGAVGVYMTWAVQAANFAFGAR
jgi:hypothetical protein